MTISTADWKRYINRLRRISEKAAEEMQRYVQLRGFGDTEALVEYAYALATRYGEAAATAACDMFEAVAEASGKTIPGALPAETATYGETARAVRGALNQGEGKVPDTVGRLVKQAGADTTLQNAERYGAEFAWVPMGDTCAFCRMLASNGWQRQSKKAMKGGHAEHIHANCDCQYAVRFDGKGGVAGYDPDEYRAAYDAAEGDTWQEKLNSLRREQYKRDGEKIRAQKRAVYAERNEFVSVLDKYRKSATPGVGKVDIPDDREIKNREEINCRLLHKEFGGDISMPKEEYTEGRKNPDYLWRNKYWEEKEPTAYTKNAVSSNIREAIHQIAKNPGGVVLDIGGSSMSIEEIRRIALGRLKQSSPFDCDLILIRNGEIEDIWHYRKIKR